MICHKCGEENDLGIVNQAQRRFLCEKCVGEMLRPMGTEPDENVKVEFPNDGMVLVRVSS